MNITDLRPASEKIIMRPGDAWIFQFLFRKIEINNPTPIDLDVSFFDFTAKISQLIDGIWAPWNSEFSRKIAVLEQSYANAIETGIYLSETDPSKITFAWDFKNNTENKETLSEGQYRLDFEYVSDKGYDKSFYRYFIELNTEDQESNLALINGQKFVIARGINSNIVNIHNTII